MTVEIPHTNPTPKSGGRLQWLWQTENLIVALALAALVVLPIAEVFGRKLFKEGVPGGGAIQQHLVLIIGLLGGMFAARDRRLLSLSTLTNFLKGRWQAFARVFSSSFAAGITVFLCLAAVQLVQSEKEGGKLLIPGVPLWTVQLVMPVGFAVIAMRLLWHAGETWRGRLIALAIAAVMVWIGFHPPLAPARLVAPGLIALVIAVVLGAPIFVMLGGAALILFWGEDIPIASISLTHYSMVTNPTLPTVPLFTLAGYFLAEGGASKRLVRVFHTLLGQFRGGPAIVAVLACAFFTSFTGASGVTILALGGLLMPVLMGAGYSERSSIGLLTGSGGLGLLFPPSLPLILFAIVASSNSTGAGVTIEKMFLGGLGPGLLLVAMAIWLGFRLGPKDTSERPAFNGAEAWRAILDAKWELLLPVVALVALFGGFATPVEAAAVTALYAFIIETFVYRDFKGPKEIAKTMAECGLLVGGVLLILGVALGFTNYLIDAQIPDRAVEWVKGSVESKYTFLLALNIFLLLVGCVMDMFSAIVVVVPIIVPLGLAFGVDPIHLGIIFLANMELGLLTPTAGINIFLSSYRFNKPVLQVSRAVVPMQILLIIGLLLITYIPALTTFLPNWLGK
ncbi:MAG TPA: TRAP transporter large permease subunit [Verrucomicrobiae bacterium]|nr:TRAP transporter large permease subunit [Verrucomicrobiae bacterium]